MLPKAFCSLEEIEKIDQIHYKSIFDQLLITLNIFHKILKTQHVDPKADNIFIFERPKSEKIYNPYKNIEGASDEQKKIEIKSDYEVVLFDFGISGEDPHDYYSWGYQQPKSKNLFLWDYFFMLTSFKNRLLSNKNEYFQTKIIPIILLLIQTIGEMDKKERKGDISYSYDEIFNILWQKLNSSLTFNNALNPDFNERRKTKRARQTQQNTNLFLSLKNTPTVRDLISGFLSTKYFLTHSIGEDISNLSFSLKEERLVSCTLNELTIWDLNLKQNQLKSSKNVLLPKLTDNYLTRNSRVIISRDGLKVIYVQGRESGFSNDDFKIRISIFKYQGTYWSRKVIERENVIFKEKLLEDKNGNILILCKKQLIFVDVDKQKIINKKEIIAPIALEESNEFVTCTLNEKFNILGLITERDTSSGWETKFCKYEIDSIKSNRNNASFIFNYKTADKIEDVKFLKDKKVAVLSRFWENEIIIFQGSEKDKEIEIPKMNELIFLHNNIILGYEEHPEYSEYRFFKMNLDTDIRENSGWYNNIWAIKSMTLLNDDFACFVKLDEKGFQSVGFLKIEDLKLFDLTINTASVLQ